MVVFSNYNIHRALLDSDASINLLSFTVYAIFGLAELKHANMVLQLAALSITLPIGMVDNVLIKVEGFLFSVDFVVLETEMVMSLKSKILDSWLNIPCRIKCTY